MALRQVQIVEPIETEEPRSPPRKRPCNRKPRGRYWCFTWFRPSLTEPCEADPLEAIRSKFPERHVVYAIYQLEKCPETGRLHLQGFIQFKNALTKAALKELFPGAHTELCTSSEKSNERYCSKSNSRIAGPWLFGKPTSQGKRTDWDDVKELATAGTTKRDIILAHPNLAPCYKGIEVLCQAVKGSPPLERAVRVWFLYGQTGVGKTHRARTRFPEAYVVTGKYSEGKSFDMYDNESALILDEWRWDEWSLTLMDGMLDKWRYQLQCRYYNKYAWWTDVVICSNQTPDECYPTSSATNRACFLRRLTICIEVESKEQQIDF